MNYLHFINLFNQYDREQRFSDGASRLYIKLLDVANEISRSQSKGTGWIVDFQRSDGYVAGICGWSVNTVKKHRQELENRGLVSGDFGQVGRNGSGKYHLCHPAENLSNVDMISAKNLSDVDTFPELNLSDVDTISPLNLSTSDTISPENELNLSRNLSNVDTLYIKDKEKEESNAASAALPSASSSQKLAAKKQKAKGATHEEIAGLPLPFAGAEFAGIWKSFYATNTKQAGKALTAFQLMLKKLAAFPEAFAVVMLERAVMGDWQGVENGGTARAFAEWQTEQARQPAPAPTIEGQPSAAPEMNPEFLAQQDAEQVARRAARLAELTAA